MPLNLLFIRRNERPQPCALYFQKTTISLYSQETPGKSPSPVASLSLASDFDTCLSHQPALAAGSPFFARFVQKYSKQILLFGKAQKQISCDVINVHGVLNSPESSKSSSSACSNTSELKRSEDEISISNTLHISKSTNGIEPNKEEFLVLPNDTNFSLSNNEKQVNEALRFNNPMLAYQNRKKIAKRNKTKTPEPSKAHILGSLAKLKIKDRAVLTGVFSKYGEVASAASKEI